MILTTKAIGELSQYIRTGKTPPTKNDAYFNGEIAWYTPGDLDGTIFVEESSRTLTTLALEDRKAVLFEKNTVLLSCIGDIGKVGLISKPASSNQQITGIKLCKEIDPLFFVLWCKKHKKLLESKAKKAVVPILNNSILSGIKISFPEELDDQKRIAHLLGKVEGLIARRKQHLQQLDDLLKSVFLEMFGDPVRNEKGWDSSPCTEVVLDIQSGTSYGGEEKNVLDSDDLGVLKISAVTQGFFNPKEFKAVKKSIIKRPPRLVRKGDFLFSRANTIELVAACCIVDSDYPYLFLPDKLWVFTLAEFVAPQYLNFLLKNENFRNQIRKKASGGHDSMLNISMKKFRSLVIPVPLRTLQNQFADIVEKVESVKSRYQQSLTELENLYGSLSQKAFKGELDLSQVVVPIEQAEITEEVEPPATAITETDSKPSIELPAPDSLGSFFHAKGRKALIGQWLEAYLGQSGNTSFSAQHFMETAQQRMLELLDDQDQEPESSLTVDYEFFQFGSAGYDQLKELVFQALASGRLTQVYDDAGNRVQILAARG